MVAGGMESMSNAPYYLARNGLSYGGASLMVRYHGCFAGTCSFVAIRNNWFEMYYV